MEFNITVNTTDECVSNGNCSKSEKETIVTSTSDTITLQCKYILNVIDVDEESATILVQNGINTYIRIIYFDISSRICLECPCATQLLTVLITNNE